MDDTKSSIFVFFCYPSCLFPFYFFHHCLSLACIFFLNQLVLHNKKDTSCYLTLLAANRCSATKSIMPSTSPGSSRNILSPPSKPKKIKKTHRSGNNSNNSPYSIRQQNSCLIYFPYVCFICLFPSLFYPFLFFLTLSISSLYLF